MDRKLCLLLGTRPEIIKMSPIIRACGSEACITVHTGQHYSYEMDRIFFEDLQLPGPDHNLDVGSGSHASQTGAMLAGIEKILLEETPAAVLVQGDTNTVLAGALAAAKIPVPVGHVEAGLRSFDRAMPEEINRVVADHVADLLFAPTEGSRSLLLHEGIPPERIFVTGNTIVDAVRENLRIARRSDAPERLGLEPGKYLLSTVHRQENVDDPRRLASVLKGIALAASAHGLPAILPLHPRTEKMIAGRHIPVPAGIRTIPPLGFMDFLKIEAGAALALTDSGGVQEECCILGVPCVTMRDNTERPETVQVGANIVAGHDSRRILEASRLMLARPRNWKNPFGDGRSGRRILDITRQYLAGRSEAPQIAAKV